MTDQQAGSNPPETQSYDDDIYADARAAFDTVSKGEAAPETEAPAEAAPEKVEASAPEPKADHPTDEKRYADGTFKPTKAEAEEKPAVKTTEPAPKPAEAPVEAAQPISEVQAVATIQGAPPPGWSIKSKAEWDKLPEHIRADIIKREKEVNDGFSQYEGMRELRPYVERARSQGQTLKQVLDSFIGYEDFIRSNPLQGILHIANGVGMTPQKLAMELAPYLGQSNGQQYAQPMQDQYGTQPPAFDPAMFQQWLNPLSQEVNSLKSFVQQIQQAETARYTTAFNAAQARFSADPAHRFYDNVRQEMARLFQAGIVQETGDHYADLKAAYEKACALNPEISEILLNEKITKIEADRKQTEQAAAEKARLASRSITGSPAAGAKVDPDDKDDSIEADVRRAYRAHAA